MPSPVTISTVIEASMFEINPGLKISRHDVGDSDFCLIADDFLLDPRGVVAYARAHAGEFELQKRGYPGLLMTADDTELTDVYGFFRKTLSREMRFCRGGIKLSTFFSMVTLQPEELNWTQRNCHTDPRIEAGRANFAGVLYLFDNAELGGTGFYRFRNRAILERATAIGESDPSAALAYLQEHEPMYREPPSYVTKSCEVAELLTVVAARFNRAIFYSGDIPHSAYISAPELLSQDVEIGRLTLNFFASVVPK